MGAARAARDLFDRPLRREPLDRNREGRIQMAVVEWVEWVAPQIRIFHPANGGWRTKAEAARFKAMGVRAGVFDLILLLPWGRCAHWEVKPPKKDLSEDQEQMAAWLTTNDHQWAVVRSIDDARRELAKLGVTTREAA